MFWVALYVNGEYVDSVMANEDDAQHMSVSEVADIIGAEIYDSDFAELMYFECEEGVS
jgi:hypothetical protein